MKRMLIDDTQPEETRVVIVDGNKIEDVEFETCSKKQIKGNIFTAKVVRIEPSLQAAFIDYGGNRHGFLAFGEIHPDYYNVSDEVKQEVEREVDEIIERKRQYQLERQAERERRRLEREQKRAEYEARIAQEKANNEAKQCGCIASKKVICDCCCDAWCSCQVDYQNVSFDKKEEKSSIEIKYENNVVSDCGCPEDCNCRKEDGVCHCTENGECTCSCKENVNIEEASDVELFDEVIQEETEIVDEEQQIEETDENKQSKPRRRGTRFLGRRSGSKNKYKVSLEASLVKDECLTEDISEEDEADFEEEDNVFASRKKSYDNDNECDDDDCEDGDTERYLEIQRKLIFARKLYHRSSIQDVIKEGQTVLVQVVKEERGNKGAACTTYLSLAGRYCVLMPNRIKSGGVSRKITSAQDRKRLKDLMKE